MNKQLITLVSIAVIVIGFGLVLSIKSAPNSLQAGTPVDGKSLLRTHTQVSGKSTAKVQLVEFGDFQCPACAYAHPIIRQVIDHYKDADFTFAFRNFPLPQHQNAFLASEAAESAGKQGKYWQYHDRLYDNQKEWEESTNARGIFENYAKELGLNVDQFKEDLDKRTYKEIIEQDMQDGQTVGVTSTPTFFLNNVKLDHTYSLDEFKAAIDKLLTENTPITSTTTPTSATTTP